MKHPPANGFPLAAEGNENKFKLLYLDTGLFQRSLGTDPNLAFSDEATLEPLSLEGRILTIPFYLISQLHRLVEEAIESF